MRAPKQQANKYYWDPPDKEWLVDQYLTQGQSARVIADKVGATRPTVVTWLKDQEVPLRLKRWPIPSKEWLVEQYITLGKSRSWIAAEVGCFSGTVKRWLKLHKIHIRSKSEARVLAALEKDPTGPVDTTRAGREIGRRKLIQSGRPEVCEKCGSGRYVEAHHLDEDDFNNNLENLQWLCRSCHRRAHYQIRREKEHEKS